jgi:hypothetical protein
VKEVTGALVMSAKEIIFASHVTMLKAKETVSNV